MIRSLVILLVPLVLISLFFMSREVDIAGDDPVEWEQLIAVADEEAEFVPVAPRNMPEPWIPVRMKWEAGHEGRDQRWMVGWLSPDQIYFAVEQSNVDPQVMIERVTREGSPDGTSEAMGQTWQRYVSDDGRTRSLVLIADDVTTIVVADASYEELEAFADTVS